jgi:hypothetical protein
MELNGKETAITITNNPANMNNNNNNITQLNYTYEQLKGKTVMISLLEDDGEGGYDESIEGMHINSLLDYQELELTISDYDDMRILDEYWVVE